MLKWLAVGLLLLKPALKLDIPVALAQATPAVPVGNASTNDWGIFADLALGLIAYRLASKQAEIQKLMAEDLKQLTARVTKLEER